MIDYCSMNKSLPTVMIKYITKSKMAQDVLVFLTVTYPIYFIQTVPKSFNTGKHYVGNFYFIYRAINLQRASCIFANSEVLQVVLSCSLKI